MNIAIISLILTILGILIAVIVSPEARNYLKRISSVIFGFAKRKRFLIELEELGIKRIYRKRIESPIRKSLFFTPQIPKQNIKIMGISLATIKSEGDEPIKNLLKQNCKFQFLLLDPNSIFMEQRAIQENPDIKGETEGFIKWIKETFSKSEYIGQIEVRIYDLMSTMSITIINDNTLYVNPYSILRRNLEFPLIEIHKGGSLFELYTKEFDLVWARGKVVFP